MFEQQKEKKVEYLELIYDLIFVYIIGRNNSLLQHIESGFVPTEIFLAYVLGTLAIIQIWNYSTFYINIYGRNGVRDHVFLCLNMFLLYFMADSTNVHWQASVYKYSASWGLILLNLGAQHLLELRSHKDAPAVRLQLQRKAAIILIEAALVGVHTLIYAKTGVSAAYVPILFGVAAMLASGKRDTLAPVDFMHLTERAMLYVVFTFGEMIIAIASYFSEELTGNSVYFAAMAFLIVVGLFLSYGAFYNRLLDRERKTNGVWYMLLHIFLIFALNNISAALEFMREETVALWPKTLFLVGSFVVYYTFLFLMGRYTKQRCGFDPRFLGRLASVAASFIALMVILRKIMYLNIAITVLYVFGIFLLLLRHGRAHEAESAAPQDGSVKETNR